MSFPFENVIQNDLLESKEMEIEQPLDYNFEVEINQPNNEYNQEEYIPEDKIVAKAENTFTDYEESKQYTVEIENRFHQKKCEEFNELTFNKVFDNTKIIGLSVEDDEKEIDKKRYFITSIQQPTTQPLTVEEDELFTKSKTKELSGKYKRSPKFKIHHMIDKKVRKNGPDNIRKVIKADFSKQISKKLNDRLEEYNMPKLFKFPQSIVTNVKKETNKINLNMTLETVISEGDKEKEFINKKRKRKKKDNLELWEIVVKYIKIKEKERILKNNKENIEYLKKNNIREIDKFLKMKMEEIYREYFDSVDFQNSIKKLVKKGNYYGYIHKYVEVAEGFVDYYKNNEKKIKKIK